MSGLDEKVMKAMAAYDSTAVGTPERIAAATSLEKAAAGISERDYLRIRDEYARRRAA